MKKIILVLFAAGLILAGCGVPAVVSPTSRTEKTVSIQYLPKTVEEMLALPGLSMKDPFDVAAMCVAALTRYGENTADCLDMIEYLNGPENLNNFDIERLKERLVGKLYKVPSFFIGSTPDNSYTPRRPYQIRVTTNTYSWAKDGYATLYLISGGADSPRPINLRLKPSTGEWFITDITFLGDIKVPSSADPWR